MENASLIQDGDQYDIVLGQSYETREEAEKAIKELQWHDVSEEPETHDRYLVDTGEYDRMIVGTFGATGWLRDVLVSGQPYEDLDPHVIRWKHLPKD